MLVEAVDPGLAGAGSSQQHVSGAVA
jgi:hypothetical protein